MLPPAAHPRPLLRSGGSRIQGNFVLVVSHSADQRLSTVPAASCVDRVNIGAAATGTSNRVIVVPVGRLLIGEGSPLRLGIFLLRVKAVGSHDECG